MKELYIKIPPSQGRKWLEEQIKKGKPIHKIAKTCGISISKLIFKLKKFGIKPLYRDEDWLRKQYREKEKSVKEIAKLCGSSSMVINEWLRRFDIKWTKEEDKRGQKFLLKYKNFKLVAEKLNKSPKEITCRNINVWHIDILKAERTKTFPGFPYKKPNSRNRMKLYRKRRLAVLNLLGGKCFVCDYKNKKNIKRMSLNLHSKEGGKDS